MEHLCYLKEVKQWKEKRVSLDGLRDPEGVALRIEQTAEEICKDGWFFVSAVTDEWIDSVTLFFEKDVEV